MCMCRRLPSDTTYPVTCGLDGPGIPDMLSENMSLDASMIAFRGCKSISKTYPEIGVNQRGIFIYFFDSVSQRVEQCVKLITHNPSTNQKKLSLSFRHDTTPSYFDKSRRILESIRCAEFPDDLSLKSLEAASGRGRWCSSIRICMCASNTYNHKHCCYDYSIYGVYLWLLVFSSSSFVATCLRLSKSAAP